MTTKLFTNTDLTGNPLQALSNVYDNQAFALTTAQDKLIDLLTFVLVDHADGPGWGKPFTGTNKAVFRPGTGNRHYLRIDETAGEYYVDVRMFENMTDVDTGGNQTPSSGESRWYKGGYIGSSENDWFILCDEQCFYYGFRAVDYTNADDMFLVTFWGDLVPYDAASAYLTAIYSSSTTSTSIQSAAATPMTGRAAQNTTTGNLMVLRSYDNTGTSVSSLRHGPRFQGQSATNTFLTGDSGSPYAPNAASGDVDLSKVDIFQNLSGSLWTAVAELPGLRTPRHYHQDAYLVPLHFNYLAPSGDFVDGMVCIRSGSGGTADNTPGPLVVSLGDWR